MSTAAATAVIRDRVKVPGSRERAGDRLFLLVIAGAAGVILLAAFALAWQLTRESASTWKTFGASFLWTSVWDPVNDVFGALPFLYGTAVSSILALLIAVPLGVGAAVFLTELAPKKVADALMFAIELLAAVPSVILGLMGIFILVPAMRSAGAPYGVGMLTAGLILAFMILPYITTITREVLLTVPRPLKEAMYALGATRWEVVSGVSLPFARSGIIGAVFLSLGRALGETMAVTMVIGNSPKISANILEPGYSMAAVIANELAEASSDAHLSALVAIGLVLMGVTVVVNGAARLMIYRLGKRS